MVGNRWEWLSEKPELGARAADGVDSEIMGLNDINTFARYQIAFACRMDRENGRDLFSSSAARSHSALFYCFFCCRCYYYCYFSALLDTDIETSAIFKHRTWVCDLWRCLSECFSPTPRPPLSPTEPPAKHPPEL